MDLAISCLSYFGFLDFYCDILHLGPFLCDMPLKILTMLTSEMLSMLSTCTSMPTGMGAPKAKAWKVFHFNAINS